MKFTPTLPQLSSYLPFSVDTKALSIESSITMAKTSDAIATAVTPTASTPQYLGKNDESICDSATFSRLDMNYQSHEHQEALPSTTVTSERLSLSSKTSFCIGEPESSAYIEREERPTPRRERLSRYLSEGDRREIISRINRGEKQVALAKEFNVSRAAICNLYKNRWAVLTRGNRDPASKHPKKLKGKKPSPHRGRTASRRDQKTAVVHETSAVFPDAPIISVGAAEKLRPVSAEESAARSVGSKVQQLHEARSLSWSDAQVKMSQEEQPRPISLLCEQQDEADRQLRDQRSLSDDQADGPTPRVGPFLVHEASAYSYPCRNLVASLRDESISTPVFQQRAKRLARLLVEEVLTCLPHENEEIKNQYGDVCFATKSLNESDICGVSMEAKGMVLLQVFSEISPTSPTGVVSIQARFTNDEEAATHHVHIQLPSISRHQIVVLLDTQCATGDEACDVLDHLVNGRQVNPGNIYFVTVISSFEGLQAVFQRFPEVTLITAQLDTVLDEQQCIRPGIGDFMQRFWNVEGGTVL